MIRGDSMVDLSFEMQALVDQLEPIARPGGKGRVLMFLGASKRAGTSTIAREFARVAAERSRRGVWLFDLDFARNSHARALARPDANVFDASFGRNAFWRAEPQGARARLVAKDCSTKHLYVTEFQRARSGVERLEFGNAREYWNAVRGSIDLAVIDAPGASRAILPVAADADGVILVADEGSWNERSIAARREAIERRGGIVAGIVCNRSRIVSRRAA
jgi:Mrp family chromosome partitioning ATPase